MYRRAVLQRPRGRKQLEPAVHLLRGVKFSRRSQHHAAPHLPGLDARAGQVQGGPLAGISALHLLAMHFDATHASPPSRRIDLNLSFLLHGPGHQRARYDRAESLNPKDAVDGHAEVVQGVFGVDRPG